jgi:phytoene dehydrogenase-like protein
VGEADSVKYAKYDGWGMHVPEGYFKFEVGPTAFEETVRKFGGGEGAVLEWRAFLASLEPIIKVSVAMTPLALRSDVGAALTVGRFLPALMGAGFSPAVTGPILDVAKRSVTDKFILNYLEFLSFAISGLPADSTIAAAMAYTLRDLHQQDAELDYPVGGSGAIVDALVRALNKHAHRNQGKGPGEAVEDRVALSAHVEKVSDGLVVGWLA